ncbi:hypothetical protein QJS66_05445 [Kocuria rhizophila]|nr:hypothetical protein QJS66_05445 [Kocuria rhizophila]
MSQEQDGLRLTRPWPPGRAVPSRRPSCAARTGGVPGQAAGSRTAWPRPRRTRCRSRRPGSPPDRPRSTSRTCAWCTGRPCTW